MFLRIGEKFGHKKISYNYSKKMFIRRAKPIQIIGDPVNQRPDKRSSSVTAVFCNNLIINNL